MACLPKILSISDNFTVFRVLALNHFYISLHNDITYLHSKKACFIVSVFTLQTGQMFVSVIFILYNLSFIAVLECRSLN